MTVGYRHAVVRPLRTTSCCWDLVPTQADRGLTVSLVLESSNGRHVLHRARSSAVQELAARCDGLEAESKKIERTGREMESIRKENAELREQMNKQTEITKQQQSFLERVDQKERCKNQIITGVPEDDHADRDKVVKIIEKLSTGENTQDAHIKKVKRNGERGDGNSRKIRPLLVTVSTEEERNEMVQRARGSTELGDGVRVKEDSHPAVRAEWKRLFDLKEAEEVKVKNTGKVVTVDLRKRQIHLPGYVCYRKKCDIAHRGGSAVMIKSAFAEQVTHVRIPNPECILISLKCLPNTMIATCYIPPSDSPYHSFAPIAEIQAEMAKNPQQKMIVIGDLNARFREQLKGFLEGKRLPPQTRYTDQRDEAKNPNSNAQYIQSTLQELFNKNNNFIQS
ncbi:hypothetical protein CAPTEDRAFT_192059 [Capitella teleta]|uniref:Endonuclease/exonuclease/phosphatase domain-containing protein n=1 Tax=Capitella teleta TaxID=283909 RepID=R7TT14_CAPTE|nr:hypothetical protein CAPTEDRAFT_192059 [Capitella teleta]|eukprot:ELT96752.1 hypothetical protein CAPTEDRAFT_192059 [Capitella teleta]